MMGRKNSRTPYKKEDLTLNYDLEEDINRAFEILDEFKDLIEKGQGSKLSFVEKKWLFDVINMNVSILGITDVWKKYVNLLEAKDLEDFKFMELFKIYWKDLSGDTVNYRLVLDIESIKTNLPKIKEEPIPSLIKEEQIKFLQVKYEEWENLVRKENHSNQSLLRLCKETRSFEKEFIAKYSGLYGRNWLIANKKKLILRSKYWFLISKLVFDESNSVVFEISNKKVEYTVDTHAHIGVRHFMKHVGDNNKSHFQKDFALTEIPIKLKEIFTVANEASVYSNQTIAVNDSLFIKYNGTIYTIWLKEVEKGIDGSQVKFLQVNSFYPTTDNDELKKCLSLKEIQGRDIVIEDFFSKEIIQVSFFIN